MASPAFLIEGHMEKKILQSVCPGVPIRRIECNGEDVAMSVMAKFIETHVRLLNNRCYPIVIIFDRERREASCRDLKNELTIELDRRGLAGQYIIGIPDRTIENWILADREMIFDRYGVACPRQDYEGRFGKNDLKSVLRSRYAYHETTTGVQMFLDCNPDVLYQRSVSFREFLNEIKFECNWIEGVNIVSD